MKKITLSYGGKRLKVPVLTSKKITGVFSAFKNAKKNWFWKKIQNFWKKWRVTPVQSRSRVWLLTLKLCVHVNNLRLQHRFLISGKSVHSVQSYDRSKFLLGLRSRAAGLGVWFQFVHELEVKAKSHWLYAPLPNVLCGKFVLTRLLPKS